MEITIGLRIDKRQGSDGFSHAILARHDPLCELSVRPPGLPDMRILNINSNDFPALTFEKKLSPLGFGPGLYTLRLKGLSGMLSIFQGPICELFFTIGIKVDGIDVIALSSNSGAFHSESYEWNFLVSA